MFKRKMNTWLGLITALAKHLGSKPGRLRRRFIQPVFLLIMTLASISPAWGAVNVDIRLSKAVAAPGSQTIVAVTVSNDGSLPQSGFTTSLTYPVGLASLAEGRILGADSSSCGTDGFSGGTTCIAGEPINWTIPGLNPGQARTWTFPVTIAGSTSDGTEIVWEIESTSGGSTLAQDTVILEVQSNTVAALSIDEDKDPIAPGDVLTYTLHYGNPATSVLSGASLSMTLPPGTTFLSSSDGGSLSGSDVSWTINDLAPGGSGQEFVQVQVNGGTAVGTLLPVSAQLTGNVNFQPTVSRTQNSALVGASDAIALAVNINPLPARPGEQVIVALKLSNTTTLPVSTTRVLLRVPEGLNTIAQGFVLGGVNSNSCGADGFSGGTDCTANEFIFWDFATIDPGQSLDLTFPARVASGTSSGELLDWNVQITDGSGAESWESQTLPVNLNAIATLAIAEDKDPVVPGDTLTYTLRYGNTATSNLESGALSLTLPPSTSFVSASGSGVNVGDQVNWTLSDMAPGAIGQESVTVEVSNSAAFGTLLQVSALLQGFANFQSTEIRAHETAYVGLPGALAFAVSVNPLPARPGEQVIVSVSLSNTSSLPVSSGQVRLRVPEGLNTIAQGFILGGVNANSCGADGFSGGTSCTNNEYIYWDFATIDPGEGFNLTFPATVANGTASGELVDWDVRVTDGTGKQAWESETMPVYFNAVATLAVNEEKDPIAPGEVQSYTVNYGNPETSNLTNGLLSLTIPPGTTFVSATGNGVLSGDQVSWTLPTLPPGAIGQEVVQVLVDDALGFGTLLTVDAAIDGIVSFLPAISRVRQTAYVRNSIPLALSVNINPSPAQPNEQVLVSLNLSNTTSLPVADARVLLRMPEGINTVSQGFVLGGVNSQSCGPDGFSGGTSCVLNEFLFWDFDSISPGAGVELTFPATVSAGTSPAELINWNVLVQDGGGNQGWESKTLPVDINAIASLSIDESKDPVGVDDGVRYTLRYGNTETSNLDNGNLTLALPPGTSFSWATGGGTSDGVVVTWPLGTLSPGEIGQRVVQVQVDGGVTSGELIEAHAVLDGTANFRSTVQRASEAGYVGSPTAVAMSLKVSPLPAEPNEQVLVTIDIENTSDLPVANVEVRLRYPPGFNSISEGTITGGVDPASCGNNSFSGGTTCTINEYIFFNVAQLLPGEARAFTFAPTVSSGVMFGDVIQWSARLSDGLGRQSWDAVSLPIGFGNAINDTDGDSIGDGFDNCIVDSNSSQRDSDGDGYGNACDADFNDDCTVNVSDLGFLRSVFFTDDPEADLDGNGTVNAVDLGLFRTLFFAPPGPSAMSGLCN